jgi:hypothetical protein
MPLEGWHGQQIRLFLTQNRFSQGQVGGAPTTVGAPGTAALGKFGDHPIDDGVGVQAVHDQSPVVGLGLSLLGQTHTHQEFVGCWTAVWFASAETPPTAARDNLNNP